MLATVSDVARPTLEAYGMWTSVRHGQLGPMTAAAQRMHRHVLVWCKTSYATTSEPRMDSI